MVTIAWSAANGVDMLIHLIHSSNYNDDKTQLLLRMFGRYRYERNYIDAASVLLIRLLRTPGRISLLFVPFCLHKMSEFVS